MADPKQRTITEADAELIAEKLKESLRQEAVNAVGNGVFRWMFDKLLVVAIMYFIMHGFSK